MTLGRCWMHRFGCSSPPLGVHRAVAVVKEKQVSSGKAAVCAFLPRAEFCSSHFRVLIWSCKHNYHNMRGKKAWRKVNHASLSSLRTSPLSRPQLAVLQTPTLYFSPFNWAWDKLTHLPTSLSLLLPHLLCPSHVALPQSCPAGRSRGRAGKYRGERRGSTMQ